MKNPFHPRSLLAAISCAASFVTALPAQPTNETSTNRTESSSRARTGDAIARIRDEGLNHSQLMETLSHLTDVIGPRLTGSPQLKRANEWTRDKMSSWGFSNANLEEWGPFGRGWSLKRFSAQIVEPHAIPLIAYPKAWSPGFDGPITARVVYLEGRTEADWEKLKGQLKGAIVLASPPREVKARFEPLAARIAESNLLRLANAGEPGSSSRSAPTTPTNATPGGDRPGSTNAFARRAAFTNVVEPRNVTNIIDPTAPLTNAAASGGPPGRTRTNDVAGRALDFLLKEGAALVVSPSSQGDGGTLFVAAASVPGSDTRRGGAATNSPRVSAWSTNAPKMPAQMTVATEDYNRLVRMIKQGEKLKMIVDLQVQFHNDDVMAYNTVAEIPGSDLKDEVVMLGAHMDSWHSGTGATDNGAGVAATMEAMRILKALDLKPRRTIRIGLWTGEEQGLLGSRAYVGMHFGYYTNITNSASTRSRRDESNGARRARAGSTNSPTRKLVQHRDYEKFSAYYNLDNGTGKIRGVYMQGNEAVRPLFRKWLQPFYDLGAETLTLSNTGGTDHQSFDGIGLPGFQFIQDPIDYFSRTHHSNADVFDRIQAEDLKQAATIMAAFAYNTAMMDEKLPRKAIESSSPQSR